MTMTVIHFIPLQAVLIMNGLETFKDCPSPEADEASDMKFYIPKEPQTAEFDTIGVGFIGGDGSYVCH
jgi:hypothetical protein